MPARTQDSGPVLAGTSGTGGRVTGVARVLASPADFGAFAPGEILVASITTPAYTPLFALAGGVVTDIADVLADLSVDPAKGLASAEAARRLAEDGPNQLRSEPAVPRSTARPGRCCWSRTPPPRPAPSAPHPPARP